MDPSRPWALARSSGFSSVAGGFIALVARTKPTPRRSPGPPVHTVSGCRAAASPFSSSLGRARRLSKTRCAPSAYHASTPTHAGLATTRLLRRAWGFSPLPRLAVSNAPRAYFIPVTPMGFAPSRAFSLRSVVTPLGARNPPGICLTSPAPNRYPFGQPTSAEPHGHPRPSAREAKRHSDASPDVPCTASRTRPIPTIPRGIALSGPDTSRVNAGRRCRSSNNVRVVFRASRTAKSRHPRPGVRPVRGQVPSWASLLFRARRPPRVDQSFSTGLPLTGFVVD